MVLTRGTAIFWACTAVTGLGIWAIHQTQVEEREVSEGLRLFCAPELESSASARRLPVKAPKPR